MKPAAIHQLPVCERPRERMQLYGPLSLSDQELLAILLGSGSSAAPVMELAQQLLDQTASLHTLGQQSFEELCTVKGIGPAKATLILAAAELGRRMQNPHAQPVRIDTEAAAIKHFAYHFKLQPHLHYLLVLLNRQNELLATSELKVSDQHLPDLQYILSLANHAGAHSFGLMRRPVNDQAQQQTREAEWLKELRAAAKMHNIYFHRLLVLPP